MPPFHQPPFHRLPFHRLPFHRLPSHRLLFHWLPFDRPPIPNSGHIYHSTPSANFSSLLLLRLPRKLYFIFPVPALTPGVLFHSFPRYRLVITSITLAKFPFSLVTPQVPLSIPNPRFSQKSQTPSQPDLLRSPLCLATPQILATPQRFVSISTPTHFPHMFVWLWLIRIFSKCNSKSSFPTVLFVFVEACSLRVLSQSTLSYPVPSIVTEYGTRA